MSAEQDAYPGTDTPEWNEVRRLTLHLHCCHGANDAADVGPCCHREPYSGKPEADE